MVELQTYLVGKLQDSQTPQPAIEQSQGGRTVSPPIERMADKQQDSAVQVGHEVRLLQAIKIPTGYQKLVRGRVSTETAE